MCDRIFAIVLKRLFLSLLFCLNILLNVSQTAGSDIAAGKSRRRNIRRQRIGAAPDINRSAVDFFGFVPGAVPHADHIFADIGRDERFSKDCASVIFDDNRIARNDAFFARVFFVYHDGLGFSLFS